MGTKGFLKVKTSSATYFVLFYISLGSSIRKGQRVKRREEIFISSRRFKKILDRLSLFLSVLDI